MHSIACRRQKRLGTSDPRHVAIPMRLDRAATRSMGGAPFARTGRHNKPTFLRAIHSIPAQTSSAAMKTPLSQTYSDRGGACSD